MRKGNADSPVVLFDGLCSFCNASVNFIIRNQRNNHTTFAPLHSDYARQLLADFGHDECETDSIVLIENNKIYFKSTASLRIAKKLKRKISWVYIFILIPETFRNKIYDYIAKHRHEWFGKEESCAVPGVGEKNQRK